MPRPSTKAKRSQQVLSAYLSVAARYGVSGATLERIAKEAQMTRPLVRHHLGNKEDMFDLLVEHVVVELDNQTRQIVDALPNSGRVDALTSYLFGQPKTPGPQLIYVFADLTMKSVSDAALAEKLSGTITKFEVMLRHEIRAEFPHASQKNAHAVAHGIMAIYFNCISLAPLASDTTDARHAVDILIQSLVKSTT